jgi:hypothetical protein
MKTKILIIALVCWIGAKGQSPDTTTYEYCEVVAIAKNLSFLNAVDAVNVFINFGEGKTYTPEKPMKDENGNDLNFTSHIDCFNYLGTKGWKMITSNAYQDKGTMTQRSVIHYNFSRPKYRK